MRIITRIISAIALMFGVLNAAYGQTCDSLRNATSGHLVSFLSGVSPDATDTGCVSWAITQLGVRRYEAGATILAKYLDFQRPLTENEKLGIYLHPRVIGEVYPAVVALAHIGVNALPTVLHTIEADTTSTKARENAVYVWMEIYRDTHEHPKGVAQLRREAINAKDNATRERLNWAVSQALTWCIPREESACSQAAAQ